MRIKSRLIINTEGANKKWTLHERALPLPTTYQVGSGGAGSVETRLPPLFPDLAARGEITRDKQRGWCLQKLKRQGSGSAGILSTSMHEIFGAIAANYWGLCETGDSGDESVNPGPDPPDGTLARSAPWPLPATPGLLRVPPSSLAHPAGTATPI